MKMILLLVWTGALLVDGFSQLPTTTTLPSRRIALSMNFAVIQPAVIQPALHIVAQASKTLPLCTPCSILTKVITFFKSKTIASFAVATLLVTTFAVFLQRILWKPSRTYNQEGKVIAT